MALQDKNQSEERPLPPAVNLAAAATALGKLWPGRPTSEGRLRDCEDCAGRNDIAVEGACIRRAR